MKKIFTLRVDLESDKGIKLGLPKLLDLLKEYNLKASFYLVMGGESNIFELLRYRAPLKSSMERTINLWSTKEKLRMVLIPKDFVKENIEVLKRIIKEGHELGLHGWKHREWTRGLDSIDINKKVLNAKTKYENIFRREPISFASPGFNTNEKVLKILNKEEIKFISDFEGKKVKNYGKIKNIPITINGERKTPIIEFLVGEKKNDEEIFNEIIKRTKKEQIFSFYIHDLFEARFKLRLLEKIFQYVKKSGFKNKRIIDY
jgi:undecaprenyl phosphate-alpha-L-ara4FN deformylase